MWCLPTLIAINDEAVRLAQAGLPERDAMKNLGIKVLGNLPKELTNERAKPRRVSKLRDQVDQ